METPVLYFYAGRETTVNVRVRFREGAITEWFPRAVVAPGVGGIFPNAESTIVWRNVKLMPGAAEDFSSARNSARAAETGSHHSHPLGATT